MEEEGDKTAILAANPQDQQYGTAHSQTQLNQVYGTLAAAQLAFIMGSHLALSSSLIPQLEEETGSLHVPFQKASWLASSHQYSCIFASLLGGYVCEYLGRRKTSLLVGLPILISNIILATAQSFPVMLVARILSSLAIWLVFPSASAFVAEICHPDVRGMLATIPAVFQAAGMLLSYLLGYLCHWRTMCWILCFQPVLLMMMMYPIKESPYWLINYERQDEAQTSLQWYRGPNYDISNELNELTEKKKVEKDGREGEKSLWKTMTTVAFLKAMMSSSVLSFTNQFNGITSLTVYMTNVFKDSGTTMEAKLAPVIASSVRVLFTLLSSVTQRRTNRKVLFCCCMMVLAVCTVSLGAYTYLLKVMKVDYLDNVGFLPLILTIIMFMAYGFGVDPTLHLITSEVFSGRSRSMGCGISLSLAMGGGGINSNLYPALLHLIGFHGVFWFYSSFSLLIVLYASKVIPDNRGKSLVKIQVAMEASNPPLELNNLPVDDIEK